MNREDYDLEKQVTVILKAVNKAGIHAEMTGRNDLTVDGKKFSGNAFCFRKSNAYHHGTILVKADMDKLSKYLQVSREKIVSKGIESVQSRVTNLVEYNGQLTIDQMATLLMEAFAEIYGGSSEYSDGAELIENQAIKELYEKYSSWEWRYGQTPKFDIEMTQRFAWGGIEIGMQLKNGIIEKAAVYSDALDETFIEMLPEILEGCSFQSTALAHKLRALEVQETRREMIEDIAGWLEEKGF
jgi:lipoate-protein ligase A